MCCAAREYSTMSQLQRQMPVFQPRQLNINAVRRVFETQLHLHGEPATRCVTQWPRGRRVRHPHVQTRSHVVGQIHRPLRGACMCCNFSGIPADGRKFAMRKCVVVTEEAIQKSWTSRCGVCADWGGNRKANGPLIRKLAGFDKYPSRATRAILVQRDGARGLFPTVRA